MTEKPTRTSAITGRIVALGGEGDGLLRPDGEPDPGSMGAGEADGGRYVPFVLPGERVRLIVEGAGSLRRVEVLEPSDQRAVPVCSHFGVCGGCNMQHAGQAIYEGWKTDRLRKALQAQNLDADIAGMITVPLHARRRVTLTAAVNSGAGAQPAAGHHVAIGFNAAGSHDVIDIVECAVADVRLSALLTALREMVGILVGAGLAGSADKPLRLEVLFADNGIAVDISNVRKRLSAEVRKALADRAIAAGLIRLSADADPVLLGAPPQIAFGPALVEPPPGTFLQATREGEAAMAELTVAALPKKAKQAADLFSGLGAFTFPLAQRVRVTAADFQGEALSALERAAGAAKGVKPIEVIRRDLICEPLSRKELEPFDLVVFDPPRAGARKQAEMLAKSRVPVVVAVSCNPATFARDVRILLDGGYTIGPVHPIDQFRFTPHLEVLTVLRRR